MSGRGGRRANQTGRPPKPPEERAAKRPVLTIRVDERLAEKYRQTDDATRERARTAMEAALRDVLGG